MQAETPISAPCGFVNDFDTAVWKQVRDLVAANGDLKLDLRRTRAEILVLNTERKGLEERFLLRTPSPPPTPPADDVTTGNGGGSAGVVPHGGVEEATHSESVANNRSAHEADYAQRVENNESGGEVATAGGILCAGARLEQPILARGGAHVDSDNSLARTAENGQVDGAKKPALKLRVVATADGGSDDSRFEAAGAEASGLKVEVFGELRDDLSGFESSSSSSESDMDGLASIERDGRSRSPRSSDRKAFDSCDSASTECDAQETSAELGDDADLGESPGPAEPAGEGALDKALECDRGRSGRRRSFSTRSLQSQIGIPGMGGSGTSIEPAQSLSTSLPGSFLVARDGGHEEARAETSRADTCTPASQIEERDTTLVESDGIADGSSDDSTSTGKLNGDVWSSASFIAAKANAENMSGHEDEAGAHVMVNFLPLDKASRAVEQPNARRQPRGNREQNVTDWDQSSQSSAGSRSPGG